MNHDGRKITPISSIAMAVTACYLFIAATTIFLAVAIILDRWRIYPLALPVAAHVPTSYGILQKRLWLFIAAPLGWLTSIQVWMLYGVKGPRLPHPDIGAGYRAGFAVLTLGIGIALHLLLLLIVAIAFYRSRDDADRRWWTLTAGELLTGATILVLAFLIDAIILAPLR